MKSVPSINMQDFINPFIASQDIALTSRSTYSNALVQFVNWCSTKKIEAPTKETLLSYKFWLDSKQLSSYTKATYIVVIKRFFIWTEESDIYPNIGRGVKGIRKYVKSHQKESLSLESLKKLLLSINRESLKDKRDYALINLLVCTGLRLKEIVSANIEDMHSQRGEMLLWIHGKGRSSKDEFVLLTEQVLKPLHEYLQFRNVHD